MDARYQPHHILQQQASLHRNHPIINYNTGSAITISSGSSPAFQVNSPRRVLRQSTLPTTLANDASGSNLENYNNLTAPTSPHQIQKGPLYPTAYNSEDILSIEAKDCDNYLQQSTPQIVPTQQQATAQPTAPTHHRLQVKLNFILSKKNYFFYY